MTDLASALGALIPAQIVLIIAVVWYLAKLDSRVGEAKAMAIRAHKRLDKLENKEA